MLEDGQQLLWEQETLWELGVRALPRGLARVICLIYLEPGYQITQTPSPSMGILRLVLKGTAEPAQLAPRVPTCTAGPVCQELISPSQEPLVLAEGGAGFPPSLPGPSGPEGGQHQRQEMKKNLRSN